MYRIFLSSLVALGLAGIVYGQTVLRWQEAEPPNVDSYKLTVNGQLVQDWSVGQSTPEQTPNRTPPVTPGTWSKLFPGTVEPGTTGIKLQACSAGECSDTSNEYVWPTSTATITTPIPVNTLTPSSTPRMSATVEPTSTATFAPKPTPPIVIEIKVVGAIGVLVPTDTPVVQPPAQPTP